MALVECPECGKEYSSNAAACPKCANPTPAADPAPARALTPEEALKKSKADLKKEFSELKKTFKSTCQVVAGVIIFLVLIIGGLSLLPESTESPAETSQVSASDTPEPMEVPVAPPAPSAPLKTFDFTIDEMIANYNQIAPTLECAPLSQANAKRQDGPGASATILSSEYSSIVVQSPLGSDQISGGMYIGTGDDTERSGLLIALNAVCFVTAMTPELDGESRGQALKELGLLPVAVFDGQQREWQNQWLRLTSQFSDVTGLNVTAAPVE